MQWHGMCSLCTVQVNVNENVFASGKSMANVPSNSMDSIYKSFEWSRLPFWLSHNVCVCVSHSNRTNITKIRLLVVLFAVMCYSFVVLWHTKELNMFWQTVTNKIKNEYISSGNQSILHISNFQFNENVPPFFPTRNISSYC